MNIYNLTNETTDINDEISLARVTGVMVEIPEFQSLDLVTSGLIALHLTRQSRHQSLLEDVR